MIGKWMRMMWSWPWKKADRQETGAWGEALAARHLRGAGLKILHKNFRIGHHEFDLIAQDGDTVVFVEVRTRTGEDGIAPEETIGPVKQGRLRAGAARYIARYGDGDTYYRFDVVAILALPGEKPEVHYFPNAFPGA